MLLSRKLPGFYSLYQHHKKHIIFFFKKIHINYDFVNALICLKI